MEVLGTQQRWLVPFNQGPYHQGQLPSPTGPDIRAELIVSSNKSHQQMTCCAGGQAHPTVYSNDLADVNIGAAWQVEVRGVTRLLADNGEGAP